MTSSTLTTPTLQIAPEKLPTLPTIALKIIDLCREEATPIGELQSLLAQDPALAARVLRVANSPCYSRGQQVKTLSRALVLLGAKTTSVMALSFSLKTTLDQSRDKKKDFPWDSFWRHCVIAAVSCRALARTQRIWGPEEAFFSGLLGRIGQMALATAAPETYQRVMSHTHGALPDAFAERSMLGFSHQEVGVGLLRNWGLPDIYVNAVEQWQMVETGQPGEDLLEGAVVGCGDEIARLLTGTDCAEALERAQRYAADHLHLTAGELHRVIVALETEVRETEEAFQISSTGEYDFTKILETARQQLIEVSLRTSVELDQAVGQVRELAERQGFLEHAAFQDELTRLPNRRALERELDAIFSTRRGAPLAILLIDVDHFKSINDTMGHKTGDAVLQQLGRFLTQALRRSDFVGRYGGEEFVALIPNASLEEVSKVAERIRRIVQEGVIRLGDTEIGITVSVGGARVDEVRKLDSMDRLMNAADMWLYEAKRNGRNRCVCAPLDM